MNIQFIVIGDPKAQQRPRMTKQGHVFSPQAQEKKDFQVIIQEQAPDKPTTNPIVIKLTFYFARPKSHFGTGRNAGKLKASAPRHHTGRKDLDNIYKFYTDAMNGIMYKDDGQIYFAEMAKYWTTKQARTLVSIISSNDTE